MSDAQQIQALAVEVSGVLPGIGAQIGMLASRLRRMELTMDEIVADAMEDAKPPQIGSNVLLFLGRRR